MTNAIELRFNGGPETMIVSAPVRSASNGTIRYLACDLTLNIGVYKLFHQQEFVDVEYRLFNVFSSVPRALTTTPFVNEVWYPYRMNVVPETLNYRDLPGSGTYSVSSSYGVTDTTLVRAVNRNVGNSWEASTANYQSGPGTYLGTTTTTSLNKVTGTNVTSAGEWLEIEFPYPIQITKFLHYTLLGSTGSAKNVHVIGITDGGILFYEGFVTLNTTTAGYYSYALPNGGGIYKRMRFVVTATNGQIRARIVELGYGGPTSISNMSVKEPQSLSIQFEVDI